MLGDGTIEAVEQLVHARLRLLQRVRHVGPEPVGVVVGRIVGHLVEDRAAVDTELGILKTGKEADVFLLERAVPDDPAQGVVLAAKRYRGEEHRSFHRSSAYTEGRRTRRSRDARALAKKTAHGRAVAAGQWAWAEWEALRRFWLAGVPVPYPVQIDGTELLMEFVHVDGEAAPRLAQTRPWMDLDRMGAFGHSGGGFATARAMLDFPEVYKVPLIFGQNAKYIASALAGYRKGERKHPTMRAIAGSLSDQDIADLSAYFAQLGRGRGDDAASTSSADPAQVAQAGPSAQPPADVAKLLAQAQRAVGRHALGHGVEADGVFFCCAHCARESGAGSAQALADHAGVAPG